MKTLHALTAALFLGAASSALALGSFSLNFDLQAANTPAAASAPAGFTIQFGQLVPRLDPDGDPILGQNYWTADDGIVRASNPLTNGYGAAPSGTNALNALDGPILLTFAQPYNLTLFSTTLDNSTFGDLNNPTILFYDAADSLVASYQIDQTVAGLQFATTAPVSGVAKIILPGNAFYDNVNVNGATAVPEPGTTGLLCIGVGAALVIIGKLRKVAA